MDNKSQIIDDLINGRHIPSEDIDIINTCLKHSCSIFGGYLRDIISGISPRDIDVLVHIKYFHELIKELTILGYLFEGNLCDISEPNIILCKHITLKDLELHICEASYNNKYIYSWLVPNIDINVLALGSGISLDKTIALYNWSIARDPDLYQNQSLIINENSEILDNIIKREMKIISQEDIDEDKLIQYKLKGYKIIY